MLSHLLTSETKGSDTKGMEEMNETITIGATPLSHQAIVSIAAGATVDVDRAALARCAATYTAVEETHRGGAPIYGLTTGVGDLYKESVEGPVGGAAHADTQLAMLRGHATGVGAPYDDDVVRAVMACVATALAQGRSAVRATLVERLAAMLNRGVTPLVPAQGSVGYLTAPSHIALVAFGGGRARYDGTVLPGGEAMRRAGIATDGPVLREGHAMISGTYEITALAALALDRTAKVLDAADVTAAMCLEALRGNTRGWEPPVQRLRPQPGQVRTAARLMSLLEGSEPIAANRHHRLQDALSLRCVPQVHGAARDTFDFVGRTVAIEINAVTDNPAFVLRDDGLVEVLANGNGHGAACGQALDYLAISVATVANMSHARLDRLNNASLSGLPPFLSRRGGAESGLMVLPVTAAALLGEIRQLAGPSSVHSMVSVAGQEDHISQGVNAGRKLLALLDRAASVVAIELLCAAQALDFRLPTVLGHGTGLAHRALRSTVEPYESQTDLGDQIEAARRLVLTGTLGTDTPRTLAEALR
ncbi:aromatic amino acid ammonia-lyase [Streptomyces sp. NPDC005492]|uniref:HAL/PAL/TAL family ammonia-lyase n=1 Tax=Streptomyces sp. NPDC005492 TaxID=3156883 RepID=UPI0033BF8B1D